ncbi:MAG: hypothetical protein JW959_14845 [Pirellulales bacterium]|nr:hypothetical protein [Pirellulales bacterium]
MRLGRENATLDPTATLGQKPIVAVPQSRESEINSEVEILRSRALIEKVVDALGSEKIIGKDDREKAIRRLSKRLEVESAKKSSVISVSFRGPTPELSRDVVAALIDAYLDEHGRLNRTRGMHEFFAAQTRRLREKLSRGEERLRDLKDETGLASPAAQRKQMVARVGRIEDDLLKTEEMLAVEEANVDNLRRKASSLPATQVKETEGHDDDGTNRMRERFYALQLEQKRAQSQYTDEHPKMRQLHEQIAAAKKILEQEEKTLRQVTREPGRLRQEAELALLVAEPKLAALRSQSALLKGQLAAVRLQLNRLNADELRVAAAQREVDLIEEDYRKYSTNLEQARIDRQLEAQRMSNVGVVQPASFEPRPVSPRVLLNCLLGFFAAALGGLGLPLAIDHYERMMRPPQIATVGGERGEERRREPILAAFARVGSR